MKRSTRYGRSRRIAVYWMFIIVSLIFSSAFVTYASTVSAAEDDFSILKIEIQGNTLFSADFLRNSTRKYLGINKTIKDLEIIQNAVVEVYKKSGYTLVSAAIVDPPDSNGLLTVFVKEDVLRNITIKGNKYMQEKHILQALPALKKGSALNLKMLDNQIMAANENPSRVIAVSLQTIDVGVFDANITVTEDKMIKHSISLDNTGNRNQDPLRIRYRFTHAGLGSQRDATGIFIYSSSPNNDIQQYLAYYNQPLSSKGDSLYLLTAYSNSATGLSQTGFGDFNVAGSGQFYSLHYARPLYRSLSTKWALDFGIEYHKSIDTTSFSGIDVGPDVNSFPFSIAAQYNWKGKVDTVSANIIYVRNISGGYLNDDETYNKVRPGASSRYQLWRGNITYLHRFKNGWIFNNRYDWQYTTQPLIPDEELGLGGVRSIRGLEEREALGDKGVSASFELYTPPLGHGIRLLAFYDIGQFWSFNFPYNNLIGPTTISSTGIGIRWTINRRLAFNADYAYVIKGYGTTPTHGTRIHFDLTATF